MGSSSVHSSLPSGLSLTRRTGSRLAAWSPFHLLCTDLDFSFGSSTNQRKTQTFRNQLKMHKTGGWRIFLGVGRHPGRPPPHDFPGNHPDHPGHPGQPGHPGLPGRPGRLVVHSPPLLAGQVLCPCPVPNLLTNSIAIINSYKRHPPQRRVAAMPRQPWTSTPIVSSSTTASLIVVSNVTIP